MMTDTVRPATGVSGNHSSAVIARFVSGLTDAALPPEVAALAKQSLIDWFAACMAARTDREASLVADVVHAWRSQGRAVAIDGRTGSAAAIALVNATYAHALDYDDFHIDSLHHAGAPTHAAALALAMERGQSGEAVLRAFVAGFEVGTRMGMHEAGLALGNAGWHPTCVLGHLSSSIACASLLRFDPDRIERAIGFAAAQVGGLMSCAGTIAKPFLVGKSAMAGVVSAELAEKGASVPGHLLDGQRGLFATLFQKDVAVNVETLGVEWQVVRNTFKPYSACQLTHASIDAARAVAGRLKPEAIASVRAYVNPFALKIAGHEKPTTPLQARFSLKHCIAMTLLGHGASPTDFDAEHIRDCGFGRLRDLIEIVPTVEMPRTSAKLEVAATDGNVMTEIIPAALGSLEQPMSMADTERKFLDSASGILGRKANAMLDALKHFEDKGSIEEVAALLSAV